MQGEKRASQKKVLRDKGEHWREERDREGFIVLDPAHY